MTGLITIFTNAAAEWRELSILLTVAGAVAVGRALLSRRRKV